MTRTLVLADKLGASAMAGVNGPPDDVDDWDRIDWGKVEDDVRRLRHRIFTATRSGDLKKVRSLQKLMLRSRANTLISVRRVTQVNAGRRTAGVDGHVVIADDQRAELAWWIHHQAVPWRVRPVRRVYIPKSGGKRRPLGIPVIVDRVLQARALNALEPEWEARFESKSYGFRPGRSCHDAIQYLFQALRGKNPQRLWVLDADLASAFDRIDHGVVVAALGGFPGRGLVRGWLKSGVVEEGQFTATEEGVPQGGVISPLLLNIALHGMEEAAGVRYRTARGAGGHTHRRSPQLVRYADDLVALCHSVEQAEQVKARLGVWLAARGLTFNEDKTRIVHVDDGFDFLGFNVRRYNGKLLIKPSPTAIKRIKRRLRDEIRRWRGDKTVALLRAVNPIVHGWAAHYKRVVSKKVFNDLDSYMWHLTYRWARRRHPNKSRRWVVSRYFGQFNAASGDRWVFGDRATGGYLRLFSWTKIVRHVLVKGTASVDDPALASYWKDRRRKQRPPVNNATLRLLTKQAGKCSACQDYLLHADHQPQSPQGWEQWLRGIRTAMSKDNIIVRTDLTSTDTTIRLIHTSCWKRYRRQQGLTNT